MKTIKITEKEGVFDVQVDNEWIATYHDRSIMEDFIDLLTNLRTPVGYELEVERK